MDAPATLQITYANYRVIRDAAAGTTATYTVYRHDGSECCRGVSWADVEQIIHQDQAGRPN